MRTIIKITVSLVLACAVLAGCATKQKTPPTTPTTPSIVTPSTGQNNYTTNQQCIDVIRKFEGVRLKAYKGPGGHWLIGYGHKAGVTPKMRISQVQAESYLKADLKEVEQNINRLVKVQVNNNQFSAMVCLAYNIGWGNFASSTLLRKLNQGDFEGAADEFLVWRMVNKKINSHQEKRRAREREIFTQ